MKLRRLSMIIICFYNGVSWLEMAVSIHCTCGRIWSIIIDDTLAPIHRCESLGCIFWMRISAQFSNNNIPRLIIRGASTSSKCFCLCIIVDSLRSHRSLCRQRVELTYRSLKTQVWSFWSHRYGAWLNCHISCGRSHICKTLFPILQVVHSTNSGRWSRISIFKSKLGGNWKL